MPISNKDVTSNNVDYAGEMHQFHTIMSKWMKMFLMHWQSQDSPHLAPVNSSQAGQLRKDGCGERRRDRRQEWARKNSDSKRKDNSGTWESEEVINNPVSPADILADEKLCVFQCFWFSFRIVMTVGSWDHRQKKIVIMGQWMSPPSRKWQQRVRDHLSECVGVEKSLSVLLLNLTPHEN